VRKRRGSILLGVLLVVVLATLVATTAAYRARANTDMARASLRESESRALLRSGLRVVLAEFAEARDDLIGGGVLLNGGVEGGLGTNPLRISDAVVISEVGGRRGIVRVIPSISGSLAASESAKLDLNRATREMLLMLPGMTEVIADAVVARRGSRPFEAIEELLTLEEIDPDMLFGDLQDWADRYMPVDQRDPRADAIGSLSLSVPWADLLTVFAADPNVQSDLPSDGAALLGEARLFLPLNGEGADDAIEEAREGLTPGFTVEELQRLMSAPSESVLLVQMTRHLGVDRWSAVLDSVTTSADPYVVGRIDLTNAPQEVLVCVPGIDEDAADEIVRSRADRSARELAGVAWPVEQGILSAEQFRLAAPWLVTRSLQYRVILEAGFETGVSGPRSGDLSSVELEQRVVAEVVIDISGPRARIAYLRDVTWLIDALDIHEVAREERQGQFGVDWYEFDDPFAVRMSMSEDEGAGAGIERPRDRAQQQREQMRQARQRDRGGPDTDMGVGAVPPRPEGRDRRLGRWNGNARTGGG